MGANAKTMASAQAAYQAAQEQYAQCDQQAQRAIHDWQQGLLKYGFSDEPHYLSARLNDDTLTHIEKQITQYEERGAMLNGELQALSRQLNDKEPPLLEPLCLGA